MNPWCAKTAVLAALLSFILIRWPHGSRSMKSRIAENRKGRMEVFLLLVAAITTTFLPMIWLVSGVFGISEYPLHPIPYGAGVFLAIWGFGLLFLFRINREEQMMVDKFGAEYEEYRKRSGRLIPRFG